MTGPYASAILRFELLFPPSYPEAAPLLIFSTDIFHPLLVPLTTYTFSPGAVDPTATYSASETERLPPGAFSLRYRFPQWFPTVERGRTGVRASHGSRAEDGSVQAPHNDEHSGLEPNNADDVRQPTTAITITLLQYVKSAFENPEVLDDLPLDAAGNPNAWHAWRSHRGLSKAAGRSVSPTGAKPARAGASPRNPADWNWDGVWEARVRNGIEESTSDALLFGGKNARTGQNLADPVCSRDLATVRFLADCSRSSSLSPTTKGWPACRKTCCECMASQQ